MTKPSGQPVIVTTEHRGVFFGFADDISGDVIDLKHSRMAIYWGTTRGIGELAECGPTEKSRIGAPCDAKIRKVTAVFHVNPEAVAKWMAA